MIVIFCPGALQHNGEELMKGKGGGLFNADWILMRMFQSRYKQSNTTAPLSRSMGVSSSCRSVFPICRVLSTLMRYAVMGS